MEQIKIRPLRADEVEVRVGQKYKNGKGATYLLYKDARCDMRILDELFSPWGWIRDHKEMKGNIYCGVSIKNPTSNEWVTKWDCGAESNVEKEKGEASDSFKRACFNWGIGIELYTSPRIGINFKEEEMKDGAISGLKVTELESTEDKKIVLLEIRDKYGKGDVRFNYASLKFLDLKMEQIKAECKTREEVTEYMKALSETQRNLIRNRAMEYYNTLPQQATK